MTEDPKDSVESLIKKAAEAHESEDALRFSQAALNAAHALVVVSDAT
jgi:hypothetical protein